MTKDFNFKGTELFTPSKDGNSLISHPFTRFFRVTGHSRSGLTTYATGFARPLPTLEPLFSVDSARKIFINIDQITHVIHWYEYLYSYPTNEISEARAAFDSDFVTFLNDPYRASFGNWESKRIAEMEVQWNGTPETLTIDVRYSGNFTFRYLKIEITNHPAMFITSRKGEEKTIRNMLDDYSVFTGRKFRLGFAENDEKYTGIAALKERHKNRITERKRRRRCA